MTAPVGSIVRMTYDANPGLGVRAGDVLEAGSGRLYLVTSARLMARSMRPRRYAIAALVIDRMPPARTDGGVSVVHRLVWNKRG